MLADDTSTIRLVGFAAAQQKKLEEYQQKKVAVELHNCEVKQSRHGEGYELMLKSGSSIRESPKKIDVSTLMVDDEKSKNEITLEQLPEITLFQKVTVTVKIIKVNNTVHLAGATQMISLELSGFSTHIMLDKGAPLICLLCSSPSSIVA